MGNHDSKIVAQIASIERDACIVGSVASCDQEADSSVVRARASCDECRLVSGRAAWRLTAQDRLDAGRGGWRGPWRQQAILGRRDRGADALREIVRDYVIEHLADDDAVLVIDETGFFQAGQGVVRSGAVIRWFGGQDHELPDRSIRCLCFAPRSCVHRPRAVSSEEWTDDPDRLKALYGPPTPDFQPNQSLRRE
jgi:hypothetical protein